MRVSLTLLAALLLTTSLATVTFAEERDPRAAKPPQRWGTVLGRVTFDSDDPPLRVVPMNGPIPRLAPPPGNPAGVPIPVHTVEDSLLVGENRGLANAFVYLRSKPSRVHPADEKAPPRKLEFTADNQLFAPHALLARRGDTLILKNAGRDPLNFRMQGRSEFNIMVKPDTTHEWTLKESDTIPQRVDSNIMQWMRGMLLVRDDSYADVTNERGVFVIANLPLNEPLDLQLWHERAGYLRNITSTTGHKTSPVGQIKITLTEAVTDLGEFQIPAALFKD